MGFTMYFERMYKKLVADPREHALIKERFPDLKASPGELERSIGLLLCNMDPVLDYPVALPPNIVPVGGLQATPSKPLPKRTGPTRIPLFGSRIPIPGQLSAEAPRIVPPSSPVLEVTRKDIGKKVRVAEKEGVLRFVGNVHFNQGVWCGIELPTACGKNDGCVRGVRYFACPDSRGLMAPLCKVLLAEDEYEEEDVSSGPHSMLFGIKEPGLVKDSTHSSHNETVQLVQSATTKKSFEESPRTLIRSDTYEALNHCGLETSNRYAHQEVKDLNLTFPACTTSDDYATFTVANLTYLNDNNFPDIVNSTRCLGTHEKTEDVSSTSIDDNNQTVILNTTCNKALTCETYVASESYSIRENVHIASSTTLVLENTTFSEADGFGRTTFIVDRIDNKSLRLNQACTGQMNETVVKTSNETFERPSNFQNKIKSLRLSEEFVSPPPSSIVTHSTPIRTSDVDVESSPRRRVRASPAPFNNALEDDATKRDSLEFEESLGILTPEQMADVTSFAGSRTPSSENIGSLPNDIQNINTKLQGDAKTVELGSPNLVDASIKDVSLGIIDEHILSNLTMKSDTTMNMELPLDSIDNQTKDYTFTRLDQTPSPEDLPLDPTPVIESECKTEPTKSKTTSSFITSITSITSLDTGYQGDGEMSRPASRGPEHSPLTRRPLQRPQPRRPDPMTDSDFYTESDADNHEEHPIRGDRLARVIDGTLYGVDPQAAADIYVNNRENMDSSGIFTDIEGNTRADELSSGDNVNQNEIPDASPSPSDTSSKTISNDSQNNAPSALSRTNTKNEGTATKKSENKDNEPVETTLKHKSPTPSSIPSSPASVRSPRHTSRDDSSLKKYKMPKRNVTSKVKSVVETNNQQNAKELPRSQLKKPAGRWDAVMNKISKSSTEKPNLKDIKPKVFTSHSNSATRQNGSPRTPVSKMRRNRTRPEPTTPKNNNNGSLHSSASDLSSVSPAKLIGSAKKKAEVVKVTQVLTAAKLSPRTNHKNNALLENKKPSPTVLTSTDNKFASRRPLFNGKDKKPSATSNNKDCGRAAVKGGRVSPGARPPQQNRVPVTPGPKTAEALAILVQHLVFNLDAFQTPSLKRQLEKTRLATEQARISCKQLEETLSQTQLDHARILESERAQHRKNITDILEQHKANIAQLNQQRLEAERQLVTEHEGFKQELILSHNDQLLKLRGECNKLQRTHEQALEILREENDSIREEIDEKNTIIQKLEAHKKEGEVLEKDFKLKELKLREELLSAKDEITQMKEENLKIMNLSADGKENKLQTVLAEVESLRAVLEIKQTEVSELRRTLAEANQKAELLPSALERVSVLTARCEDLQSQLEQKTECEHHLLCDNKKLQESLKEEFNHSKRLIQYNEELQWKLKQNKEVVTRVLEQAEETAFNRSLLSSSFNERHTASKQLERTMSFRERSLSNRSYNSVEATNGSRSRKSKNSYDLDEDSSPPTSPKIKGVVEKLDSVSYVLEMEESPEMIANRIVRRSFRNSTPPKNTPTKSPANKRPRMKGNPLSLSASTSAIMPSKNDHTRSRSVSMRNGDTGSSHSDEVFLWHSVATSTPQSRKYSSSENDETYCTASSVKLDHHNIDLDDNYNDDIKIPTLPSEIGRKSHVQSLPVPKHLAGEAMVSESNSEDESSASSSSAQL